MKMYFFDEYKFDGEYFVGEGERFGNDISDYLLGTIRGNKTFMPTGFDKDNALIKGLDIKGQPSPDMKWLLIQNKLKWFERIKLNYPEDDAERSFLHMVGYFNFLLGPLGKNDFIKEGEDYVCYKFKFDKEWFEDECTKLEKLGRAFYEYHGFSANINVMPEEYTYLHNKKYNFTTEKQKEAASALSQDQVNIAYKYLTNQELTENELIFFNRIDCEAVEYLKRWYIGADELTTSEKRKMQEYEEKWQIGDLQRTINVKAKNSPEVRQAFLDALNDMMHNVKTIRIWDEDEKTFRTEEMPINCFGYYVLYALQSLQTNKAYYKCESCGRAIFINHKSLRVCEGCKTRRRQRKFNIKKDIEKGLSLEQILKNRNRMDRDELIQFYNELTAN